MRWMRWTECVVVAWKLYKNYTPFNHYATIHIYILHYIHRPQHNITQQNRSHERPAIDDIMFKLFTQCKIILTEDWYLFTFGKSLMWLASSNNSSKLREYRRISSGTAESVAWRLSMNSTWRLHPLKIGMHLNMMFLYI